MADEFDDVPPLEDMSELIQQVEAIKKSKPQKQPSNTAVENSSVQNDDTARNTASKVQVAEKKKTTPDSGFGGFKKGFLFGSSSKSSPASQNKSPRTKSSTETTMPHIKPSDKSEQDALRIPEVQNAMQAGKTLIDNTDTWLTEDLLDKVSKNPSLMKRLMDPSFVQAFSEFQSNPNAAMAKNQGNPEMQGFIKEFCGLMGDHFSTIETQPSDNSPVKTPAKPDIDIHNPDEAAQITSQDDKKMQEILANPEIREILQDPRIQRLFEVLRTDPDKAQRVLQTRDPEVRRMIGKLCDAGLLQIQR